MLKRRTIARLIGIQRVLVKYGLDDIIKQTHLLRPLRFFFYLFPRRRDTSAPLGERIRLALEELGPIFVKFGQAVSTRRDLLPRDIADTNVGRQLAGILFCTLFSFGESLIRLLRCCRGVVLVDRGLWGRVGGRATL